jgi:hypothetical protein
MKEAVEKLVTDITYCKKIVITSTSYKNPTENTNDVICKIVEVKNRSGVDIFVKPNETDEFPLANGEDRVVMVKKLSDIKLARQSGSGNVTVHLIYEN